MEKKNIMTREEFKHFETIDAMYDMYLSVVTGFNRLVDICNDGSEKIADLVIERDNLSKGVQKLIGERDELIERHNVYTSALNKDIADKAAKIDLLEKEIEGRKEGYVALKELMDTKYISIDEHNNICEEFKKKIEKLKRESEKWQDLAKMNRDTICNQYDVCEDFKNKIADLEEKVKHQRENLDGINRTLEIRTKENESLIKVRNNLNKEIEAHESENARLTDKILGLKEEVKKRDKCIMEKNESINTGNEAIVNLRKQIGEHEEENKRLSEKIMKLHDTITELSHDIDNYKSWNASLHKDIKELKKEKEDDYGKSGFKRYIEHLIEEEERAVPERFKERLNKEITAIFTKEEETEVNGVGRTNSGRYPWGAKVNDIPCGEDSIE